MPIETSCTADGHCVEFSLIGQIYGADIIYANMAFHEKYDNALLKYKVIDKSRTTESIISLDEVKAISQLDRGLLQQYPRLMIVFIIRRDQEAVTTQQWTALSGGIYGRVRFFDSRKEAQDWMESH